MTSQQSQFTVIVPAAGVGKRMQADRPKQYLALGDKCVLEHTLDTLISHPKINHIIVALNPDDPYFEQLSCHNADWLTCLTGGQERADSVLAGLKHLSAQQWVLVHDAARPCVTHSDIDRLLELAAQPIGGGILACAVKDTMKRASPGEPLTVAETVDRNGLYHALTPQLFPLEALTNALSDALQQGIAITDEASAMEWAGYPVNLVTGSDSNIKITRPADLALAKFYLSQETQ